MKLAHRWLLPGLLCLLAFSAVAANEARTYQLNNRPASDVAGQLRELYPEDQVRLSSNGRQLVARGDALVLDEISALIETMDVAPAQMRITVRSGASTDRQSNRTVTTTRRQQERNITVQDGQSAHITSGAVRSLPLAIRGGRNPATILQQVETRRGFVVSPQVISDQMIELNVMAFETDPADDIAGYDTEGVFTVRRVKPGQWVDLGGSESRNASTRSGQTYSVGARERENRAYEIRVELL